MNKDTKDRSHYITGPPGQQCSTDYNRSDRIELHPNCMKPVSGQHIEGKDNSCKRRAKAAECIDKHFGPCNWKPHQQRRLLAAAECINIATELGEMRDINSCCDNDQRNDDANGDITFAK
ncbi:hypothetical protein D3C71_1493490 [compost metagenome]